MINKKNIVHKTINNFFYFKSDIFEQIIWNRKLSHDSKNSSTDQVSV